MKRVNAGTIFELEQDQLLSMLCEELKRPLVHIEQLAQLGGRDHMVRSEVQRALRTIESVLVYRRLSSGQLELRLEPVHVGSVMNDVMEIMAPQMEMSGCQYSLAIHASLQPVAADRLVLQHALISLWQAYITSAKDATTITCAAKRVAGGVRITITSDEVAFDSIELSKVNLKSTQPLSGLAGAATDLLVARGILEYAGSRLSVSRFKHTNGIGVTLPISKQLKFV